MLRKVIRACWLGIGVALTACGYASPAALENQIAETIPVGTNKDKVVAFLDANNFEHSGRFRADLYYKKSRTIWASAPQREHGVFVTGKIYVTFVFDKDDRLVSYHADKVLTGP